MHKRAGDGRRLSIASSSSSVIMEARASSVSDSFGDHPTSRRWIHRLRVGSYFAMYLLVGIALAFYNKIMLRSFPFPISMIMLHVCMNAIFSALTLRFVLKGQLSCDPYWPSNIRVRTLITSICPIGAFLGSDIALTTTALQYASISLTEIVKSGVPLVVLVTSVLVYGEKISKFKAIVVVMLSLGIVLTSLGEVKFDIRGFLAATAATFCGGFKLVWMQRILGTGFHLHPILSLFYLAPSAAITLVLPLVSLELDDLTKSSTLVANNWKFTLLRLTCGGVLAFLLNLSELLIIKVSSALSLCVAGVAKLILLIAAEVMWSSHEISFVNAIGCTLAVVSVGFYNYLRTLENRASSPRTSPHPIEQEPILSDGTCDKKDADIVELA